MDTLSPGTYHHTDTVILWCAVSAVAAVAVFEGVRLSLRRGKTVRDWALISACVGLAIGLAIGSVVASDADEYRVHAAPTAVPAPDQAASR